MRHKTIFDRPIAYQPVFVTLTGSVVAAVFLSQAVYWSSRTTDPDGWFYKSQADWEDETGLSRYEQEGARKKIREAAADVWYLEERRGMPAQLWFRVDLPLLEVAAIDRLSEQRKKLIAQYAEKPHTGKRKTSKQESVKTADMFAEIPQTPLIDTEITAETTTAPASFVRWWDSNPDGLVRFLCEVIYKVPMFHSVKLNPDRVVDLAAHIREFAPNERAVAAFLDDWKDWQKNQPPYTGKRSPDPVARIRDWVKRRIQSWGLDIKRQRGQTPILFESTSNAVELQEDAAAIAQRMIDAGTGFGSGNGFKRAGS